MRAFMLVFRIVLSIVAVIIMPIGMIKRTVSLIIRNEIWKEGAGK